MRIGKREAGACLSLAGMGDADSSGAAGAWRGHHRKGALARLHLPQLLRDVAAGHGMWRGQIHRAVSGRVSISGEPSPSRPVLFFATEFDLGSGLVFVPGGAASQTAPTTGTRRSTVPSDPAHAASALRPRDPCFPQGVVRVRRRRLRRAPNPARSDEPPRPHSPSVPSGCRTDRWCHRGCSPPAACLP